MSGHWVNFGRTRSLKRRTATEEQRMIRSRNVVLLATLLLASAAAFGQQGAAELSRKPVQQPALKQQGAPAARSAQSDCVREANRRGFAVLDTFNFQQFRDGWSVDMRVRDSRGRIQQGSCFVETRTGDVDLTGFGWGWDDGGDQRFEFNCSSVESRRKECQIPIDGRVRLVKQRSDAPCIQGSTWGQRGDRIWVDRGCRGKFVVERGGGSGGGNAQTIDCLSESGRYRECPIGPGRFGRLVRDYSNGRCREDRTWGTRNGVIWVTDGCRGRFEIQRGNSGGSGGGWVNPDEARRSCVREVERFGQKVRDVGPATTVGNEYHVQVRTHQGNQSVRCRVDRSNGRVRLDW
jgi:hypothetical protein